MNKALSICLLVFVSNTGIAQIPPTATLTFRAVSDLGEPVLGVEIKLSTFARWQPGEGFGKDIFESVSGKTNSSGFVTLSVPSLRGEVRYSAHLIGYYPTEGDLYSFKRAGSSQWLPANPTQDVVIKPVLNPVPVFARRLSDLRFPLIGQSIGFDLMKSDWVKPYGNGVVEDFVFVFRSSYKGAESAFNASLLVRFSNEGDGIQGVKVPPLGGSTLRLPRFSPEEGYLPQIHLGRERASAKGTVVSDGDESQNYFFRVRTVKHDGKIVSALYGKISGNIDFWESGGIRFAYYLNPEPLSRNMEFDMRRNLISGLRGHEAISDP